MSKALKLFCVSRKVILIVLVQCLLMHASAQAVIDSSRLSGYDQVTEDVDTTGYHDEEIITDVVEGDVALPALDTTRFTDNAVPDDKRYRRRGMTAAQKAAQKADKDYWYADYNFTRDRKKSGGANSPRPANLSWIYSPVVQAILWIIIAGGFATILILYLRNNNIGLFRSSKKMNTATETGEEHADIFTIRYEQEISRAASAGNFRLAIRLHFLHLLSVMSDRQVINYKQDRTNMDYLMQLAGGAFYNEFFRLSRAYEYVWYGEFSPDNGKYNLIRQDFENLITKISGR